MTRVRWILLRPPPDFGGPAARHRLVRALTRLEGVGPAWTIGG